MLLGGYRLLGGSLGGLVMWRDGFSTVDTFGMVFETGADFGTREFKLLRGSRGAEKTNGFKQVLPSDVNT